MLAQIDKILDDISVKMSEENEYLSDSDDDTWEAEQQKSKICEKVN